MNRIAAAACGTLLAVGAAIGPAVAGSGGLGAGVVLGPESKKPVRKPVIDLDAKKRRPGQVMPGDAGPAAPAAPTAPVQPAPKPVETPPPAPPPAPKPQPKAQVQQPTPTPTPTPTPPTPAPQPAAPILTAEPARKTVAPPPRLHATTAAVAPAAASAQVRPLGVLGGAASNTPDAPWTELTATWSGDAPIEVRVGVHAPVVIRVAHSPDPSGTPVPATLITLWPMARAMIGPELVDGRWVPGVRLSRGQVTVQPESAPETNEHLSEWAAGVRTPDRVVPIAAGGGRVAYDTVRRTRRWSLISE